MADLIFSSEQEAVLAGVHDLAGGDTMIVSGVAGSGKSVTIAEAFKRERGKMIMCPTGKAAARLRSAGVPARTIHSLLYFPRERKGGVLDWDLRMDEELDLDEGDLVVVDESSMLGPRIASDLRGMIERTGLRVVLVGDSFQLPPVLSREEENSWGDQWSVMRGDGFPDAKRFTLTEVFRQALHSPILRAATAIREGRMAPPSLADPSYVARPGTLGDVAGVLSGCYDRGMDVVGITWRNEDRHAINRAMRLALGREGPLPESGEPLVVLSNAKFLDLWNGETIAVLSIEGRPFSLRDDGDPPMGIKAKVRTPSGREQRLTLVLDFLGGGEQKGLVPSALYSDRFGIDPVTRGGLLCMDWGYCLTAHKAQGSGWPAVVLYTPPSITSMPDWRRWVYTAMTRAAEGLVVVANGQSGAIFEVGGRKLSTSLLSPKPEAPKVESPPDRVYFAHSWKDYGSARADAAREAIASRWASAALLDPERMDLARVAADRGWPGAYRWAVLERCGHGGAVVAMEHQDHVGRGVFDEVTLALEAKIPVWVYRHPKFERVRDLKVVNIHDWKVAYGRLFT